MYLHDMINQNRTLTPSGDIYLKTEPPHDKKTRKMEILMIKTWEARKGRSIQPRPYIDRRVRNLANN